MHAWRKGMASKASSCMLSCCVEEKVHDSARSDDEKLNHGEILFWRFARSDGKYNGQIGRRNRHV